jgi:hypothetical protein
MRWCTVTGRQVSCHLAQPFLVEPVRKNPLDPLALLKLVTYWTTLVFKVQATSILKSRENSMEKGVNQIDRANPSSRARHRVGGWHVGCAIVRAVLASGAHAEVPECPAVTALRWRAPVCDVHGRWGCQVVRPHSPVRRPPCAIGRRGNRTSSSNAAHTAHAPVTGVTSPTRNRPPMTI